jgi:hypothetical protein
MKGKKLSIEDLEKLPMGTVVSVERGYFNVDYKVYRKDDKVCLKAMSPSLQTLYYEDILKLDIYESTREIKQVTFDKDWMGSMPYIIGIDFAVNHSDELYNYNVQRNKQLEHSLVTSHKPEIRIQREFNIAKKKEFKVKDYNGDQKYRLNKATLEMMVDKALEENNEEDFIYYSNKLKKYYTKKVRV